MKFINKEAAKQRRAKVNGMAGVAFGQQAPPFLHGCPKETTPTRQSSFAYAKEETRPTKNLPDLDGIGAGLPNIAQQVCFHPKQSTFNSLVGANRKWPSGYKKGPRTLRRACSSSSS